MSDRILCDCGDYCHEVRKVLQSRNAKLVEALKKITNWENEQSFTKIAEAALKENGQ